MNVELYDTKTGRTGVSDYDHSLWWWSEGNGSCDCNRAHLIGDDIYREMTAQFGKNICMGSSRIIAVNVSGDLEGETKESALLMINDDYPG